MAHHDFTPTVYHTTIGPHEPVLTVDPGDTVTTSTADARGDDRDGARVAPRGNPMTGPFFVRGAKPGDTLVVVLERIVPNRDYGITSPRIAPGVLDPGTPIASNEVSECRWLVDATAGTARMVEPETALSRVPIALAPMIGCFGVAPAGRQAISTATSGPHGGNMDYRGFRSGVTVYFPVSEPGGLFFLGDGHAAQGDGEIVGTGIEISMDVTFRVDVIRGASIGWPRAQDDTWLMTVGNARPLDQCVQHATTEMLRWLETEYGFPPIVSHSLLGQCVEYDLGNVFDPAYTMVCRVRKDLIARARATL